MNMSERSWKRARSAHRVHDARGSISAGEPDSYGAVDDRENHEPPAGAPERMAKNVIRIGIGGEGGHVAGAPADSACIGREDVEDTDAAQREHDRLADKLTGQTSFLGERGWSFEAAKREDGENHARQDAAEVVR